MSLATVLANRALDASMLWSTFVYRGPMLRAFRRPGAVQHALLLRILRRNAETAFGRRHDFASIASFDDFAAKVPVQSFDSLEALIEQQMAGDRALTAPPPVYYARASGTTGPGKLIPMTGSGLHQMKLAQKLLATSIWRDTSFFRGLDPRHGEPGGRRAARERRGIRGEFGQRLSLAAAGSGAEVRHARQGVRDRGSGGEIPALCVGGAVARRCHGHRRRQSIVDPQGLRAHRGRGRDAGRRARDRRDGAVRPRRRGGGGGHHRRRRSGAGTRSSPRAGPGGPSGRGRRGHGSPRSPPGPGGAAASRSRSCAANSPNESASSNTAMERASSWARRTSMPHATSACRS